MGEGPCAVILLSAAELSEPLRPSPPPQALLATLAAGALLLLLPCVTHYGLLLWASDAGEEFPWSREVRAPLVGVWGEAPLGQFTEDMNLVQSHLQSRLGRSPGWLCVSVNPPLLARPTQNIVPKRDGAKFQPKSRSLDKAWFSS